jgi:hypothetical protein
MCESWYLNLVSRGVLVFKHEGVFSTRKPGIHSRRLWDNRFLSCAILSEYANLIVLWFRNLQYTFFQLKIIIIMRVKFVDLLIAILLKIRVSAFLSVTPTKWVPFLQYLRVPQLLEFYYKIINPLSLTLQYTGYYFTSLTVFSYGTYGWSMITNCFHTPFLESCNMRISIVRLFS